MKEGENYMKTRLIPLLVISILVIDGFYGNQVFSAGRNYTGKEATEKITMTLSGKPGMEIILEHSFGNITIRPGQDNRIYIDGEKRVTVKDERITDEFLNKMVLKIDEEPDKVKIITEYPDKNLKDKVKGFSISYTIEVPRDIIISVENSFGDIDINGVSKKITVTNSFGNLTALNLSGETSLTNKFGQIVAHDIAGPAEITNTHSSLDIGHITGNLTAETKFGPIRVNDVTGTVRISGGYGAVECSKISSSAEINNSFGTVTCSTINGETSIKNSHGTTTASDIKNNLTVETSFGRVKADNIQGNVRVENQHASVDLDLIRGNAEVNTSFSSVDIDQVDGNVIVTNQHGSITAQNILPNNTGSKRTVRLKTSHAPITVKVPETLSANITASTSFGKFKCAIPLNVNLGNIDVSSQNVQKISGSIGDGKDTIDLEASFADINVEKM